MSYYRILGFDTEPFSTSPDPEFFYLTRDHEAALTNVLIELRLRRGLSVILGDVGTGKTTLSRKLIRCLKERGDFIVNFVLDPCFENEHLFLSSLIRNFEVNVDQYCSSSDGLGKTTVLDLKEALEKFLYQKCIIENRTVTLIVDEAQKLTESTIEMLRVILNYETNENKLLQLVLLGQLELHSKIMKIPNFLDRISFKYVLNPLGVSETRDMINFRIKKAGYKSNAYLFLDDAIQLIHKVSKGYPRKITLWCHRALKALVMRRKWVVDEGLMRDLINEDVQEGWLTQIPH
ncbi:MAG: AAA family ATPase [Candidatus Omnitrophica bacterium]|nr:AAA family ATPase [Candidatus Omnitrophota bacterium]MDD5670663.1 AAA family ATPase [Candidatus Omnitrophota bacterium]